jgi:hypothetical protein
LIKHTTQFATQKQFQNNLPPQSCTNLMILTPCPLQPEHLALALPSLQPPPPQVEQRSYLRDKGG